MNKICTSPEQSKKLIELGINISTADMFWVKRKWRVMNIKVIQCVETGKYLSDYYEEYPFVGWWYYTDDLSKAMVFRNTFHIIDVMKMLRGSKYTHIYVNKEFSNL